MGSFAPLVFGTNGRMGADCNSFFKRLAEKLSEKNEELYHITITWIRTFLSFEILRSVHTCVRGSRTPFHKIPPVLRIGYLILWVILISTSSTLILINPQMSSLIL